MQEHQDPPGYLLPFLSLVDLFLFVAFDQDLVYSLDYLEELVYRLAIDKMN